MNNVDLDDANAVWNKLTEAERQEFENIVHSEDISMLMEVKDPWWTQKLPKALIEELSDKPNQMKSSTSNTPTIYTKISQFDKLSAKPPSSSLRHNIVNVLAAYSVTYRFFGGDMLNSGQESCSFLLSICANLKSNANFDDDQMAIDAVVLDCGNERVPIEDGQPALIREDVQSILGGPGGSSHDYTLAALSDVRRMLVAAKKQVIGDGKTDGEFSKRFMDYQNVKSDLVEKSKLTACAKKLEFYLAFVKSGWAKS